MSIGLNDYQQRAKQTAVYPGQGQQQGLAYVSIGLGGEAGELFNVIAKHLRGDDLLEAYLPRIEQEVGGVLWFLSQVCEESGTTLEKCAEQNLELLAARMKKGTIMGDGDGERS